jgi:hypothetical protein
MSSEKSPNYHAAVAAADSALAGMLEPLRRPDGTFPGQSTQEMTAAAVQFGDWLNEHPDLAELLQAEGEFEPYVFESYIDAHSIAYDLVDAGDPDEALIIRRRTYH